MNITISISSQKTNQEPFATQKKPSKCEILTNRAIHRSLKILEMQEGCTKETALAGYAILTARMVHACSKEAKSK